MRKQKNATWKQFNEQVSVRKRACARCDRSLKKNIFQAECSCKKMRTTRKVRERFFKEPFHFVRRLLEQP